MDLSRDEEGATQDRSNAPITTTHDPEQVGEILNSISGLLTVFFFSGQRDQVLLLFQEENAQEKIWSVEMTARLW